MTAIEEVLLETIIDFEQINELLGTSSLKFVRINLKGDQTGTQMFLENFEGTKRREFALKNIDKSEEGGKMGEIIPAITKKELAFKINELLSSLGGDQNTPSSSQSSTNRTAIESSMETMIDKGKINTLLVDSYHSFIRVVVKKDLSGIQLAMENFESTSKNSFELKSIDESEESVQHIEKVVPAITKKEVATKLREKFLEWTTNNTQSIENRPVTLPQKEMEAPNTSSQEKKEMETVEHVVQLEIVKEEEPDIQIIEPEMEDPETQRIKMEKRLQKKLREIEVLKKQAFPAEVVRLEEEETEEIRQDMEEPEERVIEMETIQQETSNIQEQIVQSETLIVEEVASEPTNVEEDEHCQDIEMSQTHSEPENDEPTRPEPENVEPTPPELVNVAQPLMEISMDNIVNYAELQNQSLDRDIIAAKQLLSEKQAQEKELEMNLRPVQRKRTLFEWRKEQEEYSRKRREEAQKPSPAERPRAVAIYKIAHPKNEMAKDEQKKIRDQRPRAVAIYKIAHPKNEMAKDEQKKIRDQYNVWARQLHVNAKNPQKGVLGQEKSPLKSVQDEAGEKQKQGNKSAQPIRKVPRIENKGHVEKPTCSRTLEKETKARDDQQPGPSPKPSNSQNENFENAKIVQLLETAKKQMDQESQNPPQKKVTPPKPKGRPRKITIDTLNFLKTHGHDYLS